MRETRTSGSVGALGRKPQGDPAPPRGAAAAWHHASQGQRETRRNVAQRFASAAGVIAVRMPAKMRLGLGGQPGTATLTGMTFATAPALA